MNHAVSVLAFTCIVAVGSIVHGQDRTVYEVGVSDPGQDVTYDIGVQPQPIHDPDAEAPDPVKAPEGMAEKIVVITGPRCPWCEVYKPVLAALKLEGYDVEVFDVGTTKGRRDLHQKYSNIKQGGENQVNFYSSYPTTFYIRESLIIKKEVGFRTAVEVRETLWKESGPVEAVRKKLPWNN